VEDRDSVAVAHLALARTQNAGTHFSLLYTKDKRSSIYDAALVFIFIFQVGMYEKK
jgi:hypothetical protein